MLEWLYSMSLTGWLLAALIILLTLSLWKSYSSYRMFSAMGIPSIMPLPIVGSSLSFFKWGLVGAMERNAKLYGKVYGMVTSSFGQAVIVSDLEMLKEICVKKFQYFPNRNARPRMNYKPWKNTLLETMDDHWKHVRSVLSPTFSSSKIKRMMPAIQRVSVTLTDHLNDVASKGEPVELKELCGRFSMDLIGAAAFGLDISSIHNPDGEFVKQAKAMMNPSKLMMLLFVMFPKLMRYILRWGYFSSMKKSTDFMLAVTDQAMKERQADTQKYHDFLQLLLEAENEGASQGQVDSEINFGDQLTTSDKWTRKGLTRDEMQSNAFIFFLAGYETVSTVMSFTLFCLANNPECLKEAQAEVDSKLGKKLVTYDLANNLTYVEMCVNEAMRLYPPGFMLTRCATEDVEVGGVKFKKGMHVLIPAMVLHNDPSVWPEPEKFDPLRHTSEARAERHPFSFIPFGMGPRNCIGMRLAQLEVRMGVAAVLQRFTPVICEKTVYPAKLAKFQMRATDGLWIRLQKRE